MELAFDPAVKKNRWSEAIGGARFELATGRKLKRSSDEAYDFIDDKIGKFDLKGPLRDDRDGSKILINQERIDGLKESIVTAVQRDRKTVVADLLGIGPGEIKILKNSIKARLSTDDLKKLTYVE